MHLFEYFVMIKMEISILSLAFKQKSLKCLLQKFAAEVLLALGGYVYLFWSDFITKNTNEIYWKIYDTFAFILSF